MDLSHLITKIDRNLQKLKQPRIVRLTHVALRMTADTAMSTFLDRAAF
jgi:hypothetical protein